MRLCVGTRYCQFWWRTSNVQAGIEILERHAGAVLRPTPQRYGEELFSRRCRLELCRPDRTTVCGLLWCGPEQDVWGARSLRSSSWQYPYKYKNKLATPDGITQLKLKEGVAGKAQVQAKGQGLLLAAPSPPLVGTVTAQLLIDDGLTVEWWQTTFSSATKNDATQYKAKGP